MFKISFKNGDTIEVTQANVNSIVEGMEKLGDKLNFQCFSDNGDTKILININEIVKIEEVKP